MVSIIIPTYNRAGYLVETLNSISLQTYAQWECLVIDDGSTDHTKEIVSDFSKKDSRFKYYKRPEIYLPGGNGARNFGFDKASGQYIQWFDDDDIMLPTFLERKLDVLTSEELVICSGYYVDEQLNKLKKIELNHSKNLYEDFVLWHLHVLTPSVLFKRSFLEKKMLFNVNMVRGQEAEFFSRVFFELANNDYVIINSHLYLYRQHNLSKTFKNTSYISQFKKSESLHFLTNLKRGIILGNQRLCVYLFKKLVKIFVLSLKHKDRKNQIYILRELTYLLGSKNKMFVLLLQLAILANIFFSINSYRFERYLVNYNIKFS